MYLVLFYKLEDTYKLICFVFPIFGNRYNFGISDIQTGPPLGGQWGYVTKWQSTRGY